MIIPIDVSDWLEEAQFEEESPRTVDDLLNLAIEKGWKSPKLFRVFCVLREQGIVDPETLPDNKSVFGNGGATAVRLAFAKLKQSCELANGRTIKVRTAIGPVAGQKGDDDSNEDEPDGDEQRWHLVGSEGALHNARVYIEHAVTGSIASRAAIIAASGGDVGEVREWLHGMVDEVFDRLV